MKRKNNRGSALLLAIICSALLSFMAIAALSQREASINQIQSKKFSNRSLYLAMRALHHGIMAIKEDPFSGAVSFSYMDADIPADDLADGEYFGSGELWRVVDDLQNGATNPNYGIRPFFRYQPPPGSGMSLGSDKGFEVRAWHLYVSSAVDTGKKYNSEKIRAIKGIETAIRFCSPK